MSYISGLALGLSAGKQIHQMLCNKEKEPVLQLAHAIDGRRRYYYKKLVQNPIFAAKITKRLLMIQGILSVKCNPVTGSILLTFTCNDKAVEVHLQNALYVSTLPDATAPYAHYRMRLMDYIKKINEKIRQTTQQKYDLPTMISMVLLMNGLKKIFLLGQRPSGPQLVWWALSLLRGGSLR